jgi:ornithine cyclodeaminase/alanine dehydrogenase-like protein (mu-crystallin family)
VTSVGYHPPDGELPRSLASGNRLFIESPAALEDPPGGCAELTGLDPANTATLGAVIAGRRSGRISDTEVTIYKAMGIGMEDMIAANLVYQSALGSGTRQELSW